MFEIIKNGFRLVKEYGSTSYFFSSNYRKKRQVEWDKKKLTKKEQSNLKWNAFGIIFGIALLSIYSLGVIIAGLFYIK